ncbi:MAG: HD-GYP domain-containing protein [Bacillota bacterium]|nr:HD-GYP domain-containing protein [Bacillota bacterium]
MFFLRIGISEVKEGCILAIDVFSKTNRPILPKRTIITNELINVLHAFLVREIEIEKYLKDGSLFISQENESSENKQETSQSPLGFMNLFLQSVNQFKKEFQSWQAGIPIDINKIRSLLLPLLEKTETYSNEIFHLHKFCTKEEYMYQHPVAVGLISGFIGKKTNLERREWLQLALAGGLADCGMAKINPKIVNKKSSLTIHEYEEVKKHPIYSYKMVQNISVLRKEVKLAILEHHERLDGSGYPLGEKELRIHKYAKIIAIADIFHAMTSERFYRKKQSPFKVLEMILEDSFGKFDISIIKIMTSSMLNFSLGDRILLSDGREAEIIFIDEKSPTRPIIKVMITEEVIQLVRNRQLYIEGILA